MFSHTRGSVLLNEDGTPKLLTGEDNGNEEEQLLYTTSNVRLVDQGNDCGLGTVHITSKRTVFVKQVCVCVCVCGLALLIFVWKKGDLEQGIGWAFTQIALHAVSRASSDFPWSCVYVQLGVFGEVGLFVSLLFTSTLTIFFLTTKKKKSQGRRGGECPTSI